MGIRSFLTDPLPDPSSAPTGPAARPARLFPRPGELFGRWIVRSRLPARGLAVVWSAEDPELGEDVELAVPRPDAIGDAAARERFRSEALLLAGLRHPHLAPAVEAGAEGGIPFLATLRPPGRSLTGALAEEGPFEARRGAGVARQVASALAAAHRQGLAHGAVGPDAVATLGARALLHSFRIGSGEDPRRDLRGLGAMLHEVLTGRVPAGDERAGSMRPARVPPELEAIVLELLGPAPLGADAVVQRLDRFIDRPRARRSGIAVGVALAILCVGPVVASRLVAVRPEAEASPPVPAEDALLSGEASLERGRALSRWGERDGAKAALRSALAELARVPAGGPDRARSLLLAAEAATLLGVVATDEPLAVRRGLLRGGLEALRECGAEVEVASTAPALEALLSAWWSLAKGAGPEDAWSDRSAVRAEILRFLVRPEVRGETGNARPFWELLAEMGEWESLRAELDAVLEDRPGDAEALDARAEATFRLGRPAEARRDLEALLAIRPRDGVARIALARALLAQRDPRGALRELEAAEPDLGDADRGEFHLRLGMACRELALGATAAAERRIWAERSRAALERALEGDLDAEWRAWVESAAAGLPR